MKKRIIFTGLDTHKNSFEVSLANDGRDTDVRLYGSIGGDPASLDKIIHKLKTIGAEQRIVYEAGPCAYEIYRHLRAHRFHCDVDVPSMNLVGTVSDSGGSGKLDRKFWFLTFLHRGSTVIGKR